MDVKIINSADRFSYIDFLKFIGLSCIILAHVGPPDWIMALRNFDVPFMVIISAILAEKSYHRYENKQNGYIYYYINRIKRLVYPTWIFLVVYFIFEYCVGTVYTFTYYTYSFLLTRYGIGYV